MRLLNEVAPKKIDLKKEIEVALTLEELAVMYAVFAQESTSSTINKLEEQGLGEVAHNIDTFTNDLPYTLYLATERILEAEGVTKEEEY
jgi:hypothetical protein